MFRVVVLLRSMTVEQSGSEWRRERVEVSGRMGSAEEVIYATRLQKTVSVGSECEQ